MNLEVEVALLASLERDLEAEVAPLARATEAGADLERAARALEEGEDGLDRTVPHIVPHIVPVLTAETMGMVMAMVSLYMSK